jgi:N-acyl-D-aspartate/D-glutamate deacylase
MHDLVIRGATIADGTGRRPTFVGDVAADGREISEVGAVDGRGRRELDGDGLVLAPGWVDIHTHYDGQVSWDPELTPSSWHGVTTVVMGNCGVGFAPVRPGKEDFLVELMESVEDIPGTALHEGIDWGWETFEQYLDSLDTKRTVMDVAAQVPHCAVRAYVMGERAHDDATHDEIAQMAGVVERAMRAGAAGFSTSRTVLHRSRHGYVPGTAAPADELFAIGGALGAAGHGVFQMVSDTVSTEPERTWMADLARRTGATVTYALAQARPGAAEYRDALRHAERLAAEGLHVVPQVSSRPTGMLFGLQSSLHPFITHPTYRSIAHLPLAERVERLRQPDVRSALLTEEPGTTSVIAVALMSRWGQFFPLGDPPDYEPPPESSAAAVAAHEGRRPQEVMLDWMLERDGTALLFAPLASYADGDHEALREMMTHPRTVLGLGDGGAHCGLICDASMTTYLLTHWARDRHRGQRLPLEQVVHLQTARPASVYGFDDRGTIERGKRADLNLIDLEAMRLHPPEMVNDLPAGGRRLIQRVDGYRATVVAGEVTFEEGEATGARPGRLVRFR